MTSRGTSLICAARRYITATVSSLAILALGLFGAPSALATVGGYDDQSFITATTPLENRASVEPSEASGAFILDVPLTSPPGRNGVQPNLKLTYSSQSAQSSSPFGLGWSVNIPYIERINKLGTNSLYNQDAAHTYFYSSLSGELLRVLSTVPVSTFLTTTAESEVPSVPESLLSAPSATSSTTEEVPSDPGSVATATPDTAATATSTTTPTSDLPAERLPVQLENLQRPIAETPQWSSEDVVRPDGTVNVGLELNAERLPNAKLTVAGIGKTAYTFFDRQVHFRDPESGRWEDIEPRIEEGKDAFQVTGTAYQAALAHDSSHKLLTFAHDGQELHIDAPAINPDAYARVSKAVEPSATQETQAVTYPDAVGAGADVVVRAENDRLVKEVVLRERPTLNGAKYYAVSFTIDGSRPISLATGERMLSDGETIVSSDQAIITDEQGATTYILPPIAQSAPDAGLTATSTIGIEIAYTRRGNTITMEKRIPSEWLEAAVYPVRTDASFSLTPASGEGTVGCDSVNTLDSSWAGAHDVCAPGPSVLLGNISYAGSSLYGGLNSYYAIYRAFMPVDTSSLPDNANVDSASVSLTPYSRTTQPIDQTSFNFLQIVGPTTQGSTSTLSSGDYFSNATTPWSGKNMWSDPFASTSRVVLYLNATGTSAISKTGYTKFGVRQGHDLLNNPIFNSAPAINQWAWRNSHDSSSSTWPVLSVVVTTDLFAPTALNVEGSPNPSGITTSAPKFTATFNSATATDTAQKYQVQVTRSATDWLTPLWDSGMTTLGVSVAVASRTPDILYTGPLLPQDGTKYYWRIRFQNQVGATSSWSNGGDYFVTAFGTNDYMAKIESGDFTRYTFSSSTKWTAYDKKGWKYRFGHSSSTQLYNPAIPSEIYRWMIEDITDTNGNVITFTYATDSAQIYPSKITYGGNGTSTPPFEIEFLRENRPDTSTSSAYGFSVGNTKRVNEIQVKVNGAWERKYTLAYGSSTAGTRGVLASITESGKSPASGVVTTLPATTFQYQTQTKGWGGGSGWTSPAYFREGVDFADVNGDGYQDLIQSFHSNNTGTYQRTFLSNSTSTWIERVGWGAPGLFYEAESGTPDAGFRVVDINGDMKPDIVQHLYAGNYVTSAYRGNGSTPWVSESAFIPPSRTALQNATGDPGTRMFDVNGDGLTDQVNDATYATYSGGSAQSIGTAISGGGWTVPSGAEFRNSQVGDINGDGLPDIVVSLGGCSASSSVWLNNGRDSWTIDPTWGAPPVPFVSRSCSSAHDNGSRLVDINGDGLADIIRGETGVGQSAYINIGHGWQSDAAWILGGIDFSANNSESDKGARLFDINGDGMVDAIRSDGGGSAMALNGAAKPDLLVKISTAKGGTKRISYDTAQHQRDMNGNLLNPKLPIVLDVVTQVVEDPGFGGANSTTTYTYAGGEWYFGAFDDRRFAGFASTTKTNSLGHTVRSFFHQGSTTDSAGGEYNDHPSKIGRPYKVEVLDGTSTAANLLSRTINTWARADYGDGRNFVRLWKTLTQTFDGDASHRDTAEVRLNDTSNGNVTEITTLGEVSGSTDGTFIDVGTDLASTTFAYAASTTNTVMSVPARAYTADQFGNAVRETLWTYDGLAFGQVTKGNQTKEEKLISGSLYASTTKTHNSLGLVTLSTDPRGGTTTYAYESLNLYPATTTNALGHVTVATYDYTSGRTSTTSDPNGRVFVTEYDGLDRPIREKQPDFVSPSTLVLATEYTYTDSTSSPSSILKRTYLSSGTSSDLHVYLDGTGRTIQTRKEAESQNGYAVTDTGYNNIGQVGTTSFPYFSTSASWSSPTTTNYLLSATTYDAAGRAKTIADILGTTTNTYSDWSVRTTDPLGNTKDTLSDAYGNLVQVGEKISSTIASTTYVWNLNKKLTKITDALANVRNFTYDNLGRLLVSEDLHAAADTTFGTTTRTYDVAGNVTQTLTPRGQTINYAFDALNRPITEDFTGASGIEVRFFYDTCTNGKGKLCSVRKQGEATTTYLYNPIGLVSDEGKTVGLGSTQTTATTSTTYFRNGMEERILYPDAAQVHYLYDSAGLLDKVLSKESGGATTTIVSRITWTPVEQIEAQDFGNGVVSTSTYDKTQKYRLTAKFAKSAQSLQDLRYTYDAVGNITRLDDYASTSARKSVLYGYDTLYRLTSASTTAVATGTSGYLQSFTYDALGNMLTGPSGTYTYGQTGYANPDAVTSLGGLTYGYDNAGNLTNAGSTTYAWDWANRMATATVLVASTTVTQVPGGISTATPAFIQSKKDSASSAVVLNSSVTAGNTIIVGVTTWGQGIPAGTITDNKGNTYAKAGEVFNSTSGDHGAIFYATNVVGGSSFTVSSGITGRTLSVHEYSGLATSSAFDKVASSTGTSATPSTGNVTTSVGNELYFALAWSGGDGDAWTAGSGYTLREAETNNATAERLATEDRVIASATTTAATFTAATSNAWAAILATFKPLVTSNGTTTATTTTYATTTVTYLYDHMGNRVQMKDATTTQYWGRYYSQTPGGFTKQKQIYADGRLIATVQVGTSTGSGSSSPATIALDATSTSISTGFAAGPVTKNWTHTTAGSNRLLVLTAAIWQDVAGAGTISSATYNGVALTKAANNRGNGMACELWYLKNPATGSNTLSVTVTGNTDAIKLAGTSFTNTEQTTPLDATSTTTGTSGNPSLSLTTTQMNDVIVSVLDRFSTTAATTNRTSIYNSTAGSTLGASSYQLTTTPGAYSDTYTGSSLSDWCMIAAGFKPSTSGGGGGSGSTTVGYVLTDHLNGTSVVTDSTGAAIQTLDYLPFGDTRVNAKSASFDSARKYIGQPYDETTQLSYLQARYYSGGNGKFLSQDPMFTGDPNKQNLPNPQSLNSYSYAEGNPITKSDPTGLAVYLEARGLGTVSVGNYSFTPGSHMYLRVVPDNPGQLSGNFQGQKEFTLGAYNPNGKLSQMFSNQLVKGVGTADKPNADYTNNAPTSLLLNAPKGMSVPKGMSADSAFINQITQSYENTADKQSYNFTAYTGQSNSASANSNNFTYSVLTNAGVTSYTDNKGTIRAVTSMNAPGWTPGWGTQLPTAAQQATAKSVLTLNGR